MVYYKIIIFNNYNKKNWFHWCFGSLVKLWFYIKIFFVLNFKGIWDTLMCMIAFSGTLCNFKLLNSYTILIIVLFLYKLIFKFFFIYNYYEPKLFQHNTDSSLIILNRIHFWWQIIINNTILIIRLYILYVLILNLINLKFFLLLIIIFISHNLLLSTTFPYHFYAIFKGKHKDQLHILF
jgi:hypothetical protein